MVADRCEKYGIQNILGCQTQKFRKDMNAALSDLGIAIAPTGEKHTHMIAGIPSLPYVRNMK